MLVSYWPLNESSGDAIDVVGTNDGTVNGATQGASGILGETAYDFDGSNDYIDVGGLEQENSTSAPDRTITAWIKIDTTSQDSGIIGSFHPENYWKEYGRGLQYTSGEICALGARGDSNKILTSSLTSTNWKFICGVFSQNGKLYIDGIEVGSRDISQNTAYPFKIGSDREGTSHNFNGSISEVRVYDRTLTPSEVQYLYQVTQTAQQMSNKKTL